MSVFGMMLTLLFFPGNPFVGQGNTKGVPQKVHVAIFIFGVVFVVTMFPRIVGCPGGIFCSGWERGTGAKAAEYDTVQEAIDTFMTDNALREVTPSTSGAGGEKINLRGTQFHATLSLALYIRDTPTYCYQWQRNGTIFQYDVDDDGNCSSNADQLHPSQRRDPSPNRDPSQRRDPPVEQIR